MSKSVAWVFGSLCVGAFGFVVACSSSDATGSNGTTNGGDSGTSTGDDDDDTPGSDSGVPGDLKGGGSLQLFTSKAGTTLAAAFAEAPSSTAGLPNCATETFGGCVVRTCVASEAGAAPVADAGSKAPHAGAITVTGGLFPAGGTSISPKADGTYELSDNGIGPAWSGQEEMTFTAVGGDVPAFQKVVVAPTVALSLSTPVLPTTEIVLIPRSADYVFNWSPGSKPAGKLAISMSDSAGVSLTCTFDAAATTGTVPTAAIAKMKAGLGGMTFAVINEGSTTAGGYLVALTLSTAAYAAGEELGFTTIEWEE